MDQNNDRKEETGIELDPDYECTNTAIRNVELQEEEDNKLTEGKLKQIIQEEFDKELETRQKHLEEIEERIFRGQKLLHVIRYVLVSSFYNKKSLEYEASGGFGLENTNLLTGQNRLHPQVKKLVGGNVNNLNFLTGRAKRKASSKLDVENAKLEIKKIKLDVQTGLKTEKPPLESVPQNISEDVLTTRKKTQHRLVIGNISYFKKSLEQDNLTYKWMVYVKIFRATKDAAEVTNLIVKKVIFYLHSSYKPHDVVEVSHPPYHLSRRGWGEFPLRVQVFFKYTMNKPVDVIHNLVLDKTFTERQTLGNETVVPIFLYDETVHVKLEPQDNDDVKPSHLPVNNCFTSVSGGNSALYSPVAQFIKLEPSGSGEHNYCYDNITVKQETIVGGVVVPESTNLLQEHSYSLLGSKEGIKSPSKKHKSLVKQEYNELIHGLGSHYLSPGKSKARQMSAPPTTVEKTDSNKTSKLSGKVLKTVTGHSIRVLPESFSRILFGDGNMAKVLTSPSIGNNPISPSKTITQTGKITSNNNSRIANRQACKRELIRSEKRLLKLPHEFQNMGEVLPYLFKRLPLWTSRACDVEFKCTYPFIASSKEEYEGWNVGKKLAAEWSRANTIRRLVSGEAYSSNWNTKAIFMYGRSHSYTPSIPSYKLFECPSMEKNLILTCFNNAQGSCLSNGCSRQIKEEHDEAVNVLHPSPVKDERQFQSVNGACLDVYYRSLAQECAFVKEEALNVGVVLRPEQLIEGVAVNASERLILESVKCFAENLLRRARSYLVCQTGFNEKNAVITTKEIRKVLEERKEFESIRIFREKRMAMDFFS